MHAYAGVHGLLDTGDHVGVAGDQDDVAAGAGEGCLDHVGDQTGVDGLLGAAVAPLDELAGAQLHAGLGAQCALVAVGT